MPGSGPAQCQSSMKISSNAMGDHGDGGENEGSGDGGGGLRHDEVASGIKLVLAKSFGL